MYVINVLYIRSNVSASHFTRLKRTHWFRRQFFIFLTFNFNHYFIRNERILNSFHLNNLNYNLYHEIESHVLSKAKEKIVNPRKFQIGIWCSTHIVFLLNKWTKKSIFVLFLPFFHRINGNHAFFSLYMFVFYIRWTYVEHVQFNK